MKISKNIKAATPTFQWVAKKKSATLMKGAKDLLSIEFGKKGKSSFELDNTTYKVRNKGFWHPKTVIESKDKTIVTLDRNFSGNKASVVFENGKVYECRIQNSPSSKLTFYKSDGKAIITQQINSNEKKATPLKLDYRQIPGTDLIYLLVLGQFSSYGLAKENGKVKKLEVKPKAAAYGKPKTSARRKGK